MHAVRNITLCTKECLCLFVCPTGATDTENGQIDADTCLDGCRLCVDACPSGAIYLVPDNYPQRKEASEEVKAALASLNLGKAKLSLVAAMQAVEEPSGFKKKLLSALERSGRILGEDCIRETGCLVPDNAGAREGLEDNAIVQTWSGDHKTGEDTLEKILEALCTAAENGADAEYPAVHLCESCGNLHSGDKPTYCIACGGHSIISY